MTGAAHWDEVYRRRDETALSWFAAAPEPALSLVRALCPPEAGLIDIGGGASRLVDGLVADGYSDPTVLDLSAAALEQARARLGAAEARVRWVAADVTRWRPDRRWRLWNDRAAFHFLTDPADRAAYAAALCAALEPGGHAVIATFAEDGPERCSGLATVRWAPRALAAEFDRLVPGALVPERALRHAHVTPAGVTQRFQTSVFRRAG